MNDMLNKILVPLDGSELAERALTYATTLASATGASLLLVRAAYSHTLAGVDPREQGGVDRFSCLACGLQLVRRRGEHWESIRG